MVLCSPRVERGPRPRLCQAWCTHQRTATPARDWSGSCSNSSTVVRRHRFVIPASSSCHIQDDTARYATYVSRTGSQSRRAIRKRVHDDKNLRFPTSLGTSAYPHDGTTDEPAFALRDLGSGRCVGAVVAACFGAGDTSGAGCRSHSRDRD